jgi:hypothetical protein
MAKTKQRTSHSDDTAQSKRFIEAARKAEADESEEKADRIFKKIAQKKRHGGD